MAEIVFNYKGEEITIQCLKEEKMKDIYKRYSIKSKININSVFFLYNGSKVNEEMAFNEIANSIDRQSGKMKILVYDNKNNEIDTPNEGLIKSKQIICPECKENCLMKIINYKIILKGCKNNHQINDISLKEFEKTQYINELEIKCNNCNENNKFNSYKKQFFKCLTCGINLCPLCNSNHDKSHDIIDYDKKNYICNLHNYSFVSYCEYCKKNLCILCEKEHDNNHKKVSLVNLIEDKNKIEELKEQMNEFKKK